MLALSRCATTSASATNGRRLFCSSAVKSEIALLEKLLKSTQERLLAAEAPPPAADAGSDGTKFQVQTFNAISPVGLEFFPKGQFMLTGSSGSVPAGTAEEPHAVLLRSHKLKGDEVGQTVRAIARCGAGTNNIPLDEMTKRGIPVFNTPGANANAVKELVLCSLLLASRGIVEGINHVKTKLEVEEKDHASIAAKIEKDKKHFVGGELAGKTLAVCGLGNIGAMVAEAGIALGMRVVGYDPKISVEAAWRLPNSVESMGSLEAAFAEADFISINMPYIKGVTHHAISESVLSQMKPTCSMINMARAEIVDGGALKKLYAKGHMGKYICDFADEMMQGHPKFVCIPHLGASTEEAEDNCAKMAAAQVINFLETGTIKNSVNFPAASLDKQSGGSTRLCIINKNVPGVLGEITTLLGSKGINITQQLNTSRDAIAYNVVDMDGFSDDLSEDLQSSLLAIDAVLSTRLIWTGSAAEGPSNFLTKEVELCG
jgi:D-3-phosphoglycerate dehydrogenase